MEKERKGSRQRKKEEIIQDRRGEEVRGSGGKGVCG